LRLLPEGLFSFLPWLGLAAGVEESQAGVDALGQTQLIEYVRIFAAEALEFGRSLQR